VALQNLPVLFAIDRAGVVGPDGATHAGSFDLSYLRCIPNMLIMAPADENECRQMLSTGFAHDGPAAVRYPRGQGPGIPVDQSLQTLPLAKAKLVREGKTVAILSFGTLLSEALIAAESLNGTCVNMRFIKPLDTALLAKLAASHDLLITVEDNSVMGGAGSAVNEALVEMGLSIPIVNLGLPDTFLHHASREALLAEAGLDADGIIRRVEAKLRRTTHPKHATQI
jgi:1-deoxy-D-xylulose-5-phosphate synthase